MNITTTRFGEIEVQDDRVFEFVMPFIGYDQYKKFVLLEHNQNSNFRWVQSIEMPELAFAVASAALLNIEYVIDLPDSAVEKLQIESVEDLLVLNVASIPHNNPREATINLLAPIIMNLKQKIAGQVILTGSGYDVSFPMFKKEE